MFRGIERSIGLFSAPEGWTAACVGFARRSEGTKKATADADAEWGCVDFKSRDGESILDSITNLT